MKYNLGRVCPIFKGNYDNTEEYIYLDVVYYNGSSYVMQEDSSTGHLPTDTDYWQILSLAGSLNPTQVSQIETQVLQWIQQQGYVTDANYVHTDNNFSGTYKDKLDNLHQVQADWNETTTTADSYILNKPTIPTKTSDLNNDSGFLTQHQQLKTINNQSIVGSGNITIQGGSGGTTDYTALNNLPSVNGITLTGNKTTSELGINIPDISGKQDTLVSGTNIKTINGQSILGSGNITIQGGGGSEVDPDYDYLNLNNKPAINGITLNGNVTARDLGIITGQDSVIEIVQRTLNPTSTDTSKALTTTGNLTTATTSGANVKTYNISNYNTLVVSGYSPSTTGTNAMACFYDADGNFIRYIKPKNGAAVSNYSVNTGGAAIFKIFGNSNGTNSVKVYEEQVSGSGALTILDKLNGQIQPTSVVYGKYLDSLGVVTDSTSANDYIATFSVDGGKKYKVSGYSPATSIGNLLLCWYDSDGSAIEGYAPMNGKTITNLVITAPEYAVTLKVYGTDNNNVSLYTYTTSPVQKIVNLGTFYPRVTDHRLKVLCFGSSWFMDTWFYLNRLCKYSGITADFTCFFLGSSCFDEWISMYNGVLPTWGENRNGRVCTSNDSTTWTQNVVWSDGYTKEQFMAAFQTAITSHEWDLICFQQGAKQAPVWGYWENYNELLKIVKRACNSTTKICFNSTWTPSVNNTLETYTLGYSPSVDGQKGFQTANWENTKRFMYESGINEVSPNGALMWSMRRDSSLNVTGCNDMADDDLHPNNGLPIYALALCFYETFIAPIYGKSMDDITTLPTASWQKASVSGTSFQAMTAEQLETVKQHIRLALASRFDFNTL